MLLELHVRDLGIVDDLGLLLGPGLTVITGETGAGKTLLVDALDLLTGGRADPGMVRAGADASVVEGRFVDTDGNETVLARVVPGDGRSRAYIDGRLATVAELAARGRELVELHGQHAHVEILAAASQRDALDRFAGDPAVGALADIRSARAERRRIDGELAAVGGDERARLRELELLAFQIGEIEAAALESPGEDVALEAEEAILADAAGHRDALGEAHRLLEHDVSDALGRAVSVMTGRRPFAEIDGRLRSAQADLADLEHELRLAQEGVADDPARLAVVRERRRLLRDLCRKYGETPADVLAFVASARERRDRLEQAEAVAVELTTARACAEAAERAAAAALSDARGAAAGPLAAAVTRHVRMLAMPAARFEVSLEPAPAGELGADSVTFLLAANAGEPVKPLARTASGGERSRVMLALRLVLSGAPPSVVFDEIDAGIGGEAGLAVGRLLASLAAGHQVLCVTHLAQVAAFADAHVVVEKRDTGRGSLRRTVAGATIADDDARVAELSRMLAGVGESTHARRHAQELVDAARRGAGI